MSINELDFSFFLKYNFKLLKTFRHIFVISWKTFFDLICLIIYFRSDAIFFYCFFTDAFTPDFACTCKNVHNTYVMKFYLLGGIW